MDFEATVVSPGLRRTRTAVGFDLTQDIELVKAALLYSERVRLVSPTPWWVAENAWMFHMDDSLRFSRFPEMAEGGGFEKVLTGVYGPNGYYRPAIDGDDGSPVWELAVAIESGLLELDPMRASEDMFASVEARDENAQGRARPSFYHLLDVLASCFAPASPAYPLLDEDASRILRALLTKQRIDLPQTSLAKEIALASAAVLDLRCFPNARMEDILAIRVELRAPLTRFRAAMAQGARELDAAPGDEALAAEIRSFLVRHTEPAMLELNESFDDLGVVPTLLRGYPKAAAGVLGLTAATAIGAPELAQFMCAAAGLTAAAADEVEFRRTHAQTQARHRFYFLLALEDALSKTVN